MPRARLRGADHCRGPPHSRLVADGCGEQMASRASKAPLRGSLRSGLTACRLTPAARSADGPGKGWLRRLARHRRATPDRLGRTKRPRARGFLISRPVLRQFNQEPGERANSNSAIVIDPADIAVVREAARCAVPRQWRAQPAEPALTRE